MQALPSPLVVQGRVVRSLVFREAKTRWGRHFLGFFGQFGSLVAYVVFFVLVRHATSPGIHRGMELIPFVSTGILLFFSFRQGLSQVQGAATSNRGLLQFPTVTPLDAAISRWLLEAGGFILIAILAILLMVYFDWSQPPQNLLFFLSMIIVSTFFGFCWGLIFGSLALYFPPIRALSNMISRFLLFVSGIFFVMPEAPPPIRDVLVYNPIIHIMEFGREAYFRVYTSDYADAGYLTVWMVLSLIAGLVLERTSRRALGWLAP